MKKESINPQSVNYLQASPELEELQHLMPISDIDYNNLKKDIEETGEVRDAIKCYQDEEGNFFILGGLNRWKIAKELNIKTVPVQVYKGTKQEYRELVINDNLNRRHMSKEDKQRVAAELIKINPARSALSISKEVKLNDKTVTKIKEDLKRRSEIPNVEIIDTKGRKQPVKKENKVRRSDPVKGSQAAQEAPQKALSRPPETTTKDIANKIKSFIEHELRKLNKDEADEVFINVLNYLRKRK